VSHFPIIKNDNAVLNKDEDSENTEEVRTQSVRRLYKIARDPKILVTVLTFGIIRIGKLEF